MKTLYENPSWKRGEISEEEGFSLLELVVAVSIMLILAVVGFIAYQGFTDNARQAAVDSAARQVYTAGMEKLSTPGHTALDTVTTAYNDTSSDITTSIAIQDGTVCATATYNGYDNVGSYGDCESTDGNTDGVVDENADSASNMELLWTVEENRTVDLPISEDFEGTVDWGNGTTTNDTTHTYDAGGEYTIRIDGTFDQWGWSFAELMAPDDGSVIIENRGEEGLFSEEGLFNTALEGLTEVKQWGETETTSIAYGFAFSRVEAVEDIPSTVTDTRGLFSNNPVFNQDISHWDMSNVTHMGEYALMPFTGMFSLATNFNNGGEPLDWDVSNVENMDSLFAGAIRFDQDVSDWDISNVTSMIGMFNTAHAFNNGGEPLDWGEKTQNVENMQQVFSGTRNFNQEVNDWNTSSVTNMSHMFWNNTAFNQPLNNWDTSQVTDMHSMFANTTQFNQDVSDWDVSNVQMMGHVNLADNSGIFQNATAFNNGGEPLDWEDTSSLTDISRMFKDATSFNQEISGLSTTNVQYVRDVFMGATAFNNGGEPLAAWMTEAGASN